MAADDMTGVWFSPSTCIIYMDILRERYEECGMWPEDAYQLQKDEVEMFHGKQPPDGMTLGAGEFGEPMWVPRVISTEDQVALADINREQLAQGMLVDIQLLTAKLMLGDDSVKSELKELVETYEIVNGGRS